MKHIRGLTVEKASNLTPLNDLFYRVLNSIDLFLYTLKTQPAGDIGLRYFSLPLAWLFPTDAPDGGGGGGGDDGGGGAV